MFYVYELVSSEDGLPFYVGKGSGNRMHKHVAIATGADSSKKKNPKLYNKIAKILREGGYVMPRVVFEHVEEALCFEKEIEFIELYGLVNLCNLMPGGQGHAGRVVSDETKQKMSDARKGFVVSDDTRDKISKSLKGKPSPHKGTKRANLSEETKRKMSEAHKGKTRKPRSEETKRKISEAMKKRKAATP